MGLSQKKEQRCTGESASVAPNTFVVSAFHVVTNEKIHQFYGQTNLGRFAEIDLLSILWGQCCERGNFSAVMQLAWWRDLWLGAVSDTEYFERSGILESQKEFQEKFDLLSVLLSFTNILDKGYCSVLAAWRAGGQLLLQPFFAKSDRKFTSKEVLLSAAVATDRSANERAVRIMKCSGMLRRGIHHRQNLKQVADLWLAWGFQCNFMYKPVL